ncbi:tyrosine-type recombinase/integrase [Sphingomonas bacterium]|uniref:tyrosine-type recombinase/integrase n=1 Tax=Sphingomonas bacterium TaxID=1895847 RepID=UPI00157729C7|nr:site-specific integrase [Sphingomonas bacterium]
MTRLTVLKVKNAGAGRHGDGEGLYLLVKPSGARSWILRLQRDGKRHDIGLGAVDLSGRSLSDVQASNSVPLLSRRLLTLQEAREKASELRRFARAGRDPFVERDRERRKVPTFEEATKTCHADLKAGWSKRQAETFLSSLERHAFPSLGRLAVDRVQASDIRDMLAPIWTEFADMSLKVRGRVSTVLNYAHSKGWRPTEAPGRSVTLGLPKRNAGANYAAMPFDQVATFVSLLNSKSDTVGRLALLFTILTAARSGEVRNARWSTVDLKSKLWRRPANLMKTRTEHVLTLSEPAMVILSRAAALHPPEENSLIFPSLKKTPLSDMTLSKILRDEKQPYTVHGFRSSFRDWAAEKKPDVPSDVAEAALAHLVSDKVIRAYKRTKFVDMRRALLEDWGTFVTKDSAMA